MLNYIKENKLEVLLVFAITILALILRLIAINNFGDLWVDELFSFYFANKSNPFEIVVSLFNEDFHVPMHFVLLHYWMKLFGQTDFTLRLMGCLITVLSVPVSFYVLKDLFASRKIAIIASLFLSLNAFNIHYSTEVRFYGMAITLMLLSSFSFFKMTLNLQNNLYKVWYILSTLLLLYTWNFSFMFVFCQFLVGLVYILIKDQSNWFVFLKIYLIIALFYIPVLFYIFHNIFLYKSAVLSFYRDVIGFDLSLGFTYFATCFSSIFDQFRTNDIMLSRYMLKNSLNLYILSFAVIPIFIGIIGLINVFVQKSKDIKFLLFSCPAILLFVLQIVMVLLHQLALTFRYTISTTTVFLLIAVCGICLFKNRTLRIFLISLW